MISRRLLLGTTAALLPLPGLMRARGDAPEFEMKMGNDNPMSHPNTIRQQEAADRILKETNGRVKISVFPNTSWAAIPTCCRSSAPVRWNSCRCPG